jgi:hypothetical protein
VGDPAVTGDAWAHIVATLHRYRGCTECHGAGHIAYDARPFYDGLEMFMQVAVCLRCRGYGGDFTGWLPLRP